MTSGAWRYAQNGADSEAAFGQAAAAPLVTVRCERGARRILIVMPGAPAAAQVTVRTSFGAASWPMQPLSPGGAFGTIRPASDPVLDQIAFSRGRFMVQVSGMAPLVLPPWAEVTRVIEDCRD
ncbi:hypothetical protein [Sphingobium algorifonticola]|nr:hypothetical protein [Sphingobium algorifonticola]